MNIRLLITFLLFLVTFQNFAQGEADNWYFGDNAGLSFSSGAPVAITDGQLSTLEGCATISDSSGQLLFYTDGITVWDKNHNVMPNGTGLSGDPSSSQSGIIVPFTNDSDKYYLFTVSFTLDYSVVDMSLNNGAGDVVATQKNIRLIDRSSEKIAAIEDNNQGFWMIGYAGVTGSENTYDTFHAFRITDTGIDPAIRTTHNGCATTNGRGYLKISSDASKLMLCNQNQSHVCLHSFDFATGIVGTAQQLAVQNTPYCAEFSASSDIVYVSTGGFLSGNTSLYQFNLLATNIQSSRVLIHQEIAERAALQLAIDGKIYYARPDRPYVGVINNPETLGAGCDYVNQGVNLNGKICKQGLPPFIQSYFAVGIESVNKCLGDFTEFSVNSNETIDSIFWDFGDGNTSMLENPTNQYLASGTYTVTVTVISGTETRVITKDVFISNFPVAQTISDYTLCDDATNNEREFFNLLSKDSEALGSQSNLEFNVSYFSTLQDAEDHTNVLPDNYENTTNNQQIFVKTFNVNNSNCYAISSFNLIVSVLPIANPIDDYLLCDEINGDGVEVVDLNQFTTNVLLSQSDSDFEVTYHLSQFNADNNIIDIANPDAFQANSTSQIIFVRIENKQNVSCFSTTQFSLQVFSSPVVNTVTDFNLCDDVSNDETEIFNLTTKTNEALNGQSTSVYDVHYYSSLANAENHVNELPLNYTNSTNNEEVFVKVYNIQNKDCFAITSFRLNVNTLPEANPITDKAFCDDISSDGIENVDLTQFNSDVLLSQDASSFNISYHLSQANADANFNDIPDPTNFEINVISQTVFVRIENSINSACFKTTSFNIVLFPYFSANQPKDIYLCDDVSNDQKEFFDLTNQDNDILIGLTGTYNITYHHSFDDANSNILPIIGLYENQTNTEEIFFRVENANNTFCYQVSSFLIGVLAKPELEMANQWYICSNETKKLIADSGYDEYLWSTGEMTQEITVDAAGTYDVTVTRYYNVVPFSTCSTTKFIEVTESDEAVLIDINTVDWSVNENTITVLVDGLGDYEYSLDGYNYQDSNMFYNLTSNDYVVYIRDKFGCGVIKEDVFLLFYPYFFTPNGDSYNDYWKIEFSEKEPDMVIYIFDRFGKLLQQISPRSRGWDGTYNGVPMPTNDYWFVVKRPKTGKEYKGHFTLKR